MSHEDIQNRLGEIEKRTAEIDTMLEQPDVEKSDELTEEARNLAEERNSLNTQLEELKKEAEKAEETRKAVANGAGEVKDEHKEEHVMNEKEIRSSAEYCEAYKKYILSGDDKECRSLLSTNATAATGYVPVPTLVENVIKTAWESNELLSRINKTGFKGNLKVPFEKSADGAYIHSEGTTGLTEEDLQIGVVELVPANIKKWIKISDEAIAMGGEAFVEYIYKEMAYRVLLKLAADLIGDVVAAGTSHSTSAIGIPKVNKAPGIMTIADAAANLCDEATNLCVVMNRLTEQQFNAAYAAGNFAIDPYAGLPRVYTSALPAYSSADTNATYAIIGDLRAIQANYPEGEGIVIKWDELTYAEDDMVKVVARQYAGHGVTAPGRLVRLTKPSGAVTT